MSQQDITPLVAQHLGQQAIEIITLRANLDRAETELTTLRGRVAELEAVVRSDPGDVG